MRKTLLITMFSIFAFGMATAFAGYIFLNSKQSEDGMGSQQIESQGNAISKSNSMTIDSPTVNDVVLATTTSPTVIDNISKNSELSMNHPEDGSSSLSENLDPPQENDKELSEVPNQNTQRDVRSLISMIAEIDNEALGEQRLHLTADAETAFLELVANDSDAVMKLVTAYEGLANGSVKDKLGSLITSTQDPRIEKLALNRLYSSQLDDQEMWLHLLKGTGINSQEDRSRHFDYLYTVTSPRLLVDGLKAFNKVTRSPEHRRYVLERLAKYGSHEHAAVRAASLDVSSQWLTADDASIIEAGLGDESYDVRRSAVRSAFYAGVRSESIKQHLLDTVGNENEPHTLRVEAYNALGSYQLLPDEYHVYKKFEDILEELGEFSGSAKG